MPILLPLLATLPVTIAAGGLFAVTVAQAYGWLPRPTDPLPDPDNTPEDPAP